ncbi:Pilus assembly protein PilZ [Sulfitobacter noctilucae]|uniref:hypothetical protein n=1 Tax=Sulfitobacter noctilucae TaxID=1342302 RepID=UPI00046B03F0|nr:hypothetical protein [Sulfitobacter noctilucae]KIN61369.1 Pilus assembly protein PilZ [Sulfitobacter noctilucae]
MSSTDIQEPTPENVADLATETISLPKRALIGIFGSETAPAALIRDTRGDIHRVTPGDTVEKRTVAAIGTDRVILSKGSRTETLLLPQS